MKLSHRLSPTERISQGALMLGGALAVSLPSGVYVEE